jgi:uncharacterized protein (DUF1697 family)
MIALLRGINVGGHRRVPMAELRDLALAAGLSDVGSYIQSGNLTFAAALDAAAAEAALEKAIEARFGFAVDVIVRTAAQWARYAAGSPFPDAASARPNLLHLGLSKRPPKPDAAEKLKARAAAGERIELLGDAIWLDFGAGVARSKLSPAAIDKAAGSPVTARNWKTVLKLAELVG